VSESANQPVTLLDFLNLSASWLESKGIDEARLNVQHMLSHILTLDRMGLYLKFDYPLNPDEIAKLRGFLARRAKHEPLQHILGISHFIDFTVKVNRDVLIPRPETEELADLAIKTLKSESGLKILEIGTGSGIIPIALAKSLSTPSILTLDISESALETAKINFAENGVSDSISIICTDFLSWKSDQKFDAIISNPPYIPALEIDSLEPEVKFFEPKLALTDGKDGLTFYKAIADFCKTRLQPGGFVFLELHASYSQEIKTFFLPVLTEVEIISDMQGKPRILKGKK